MPPPPPPPHPDLIHLPFLLLLVAHDIGTIAALLLVPGEYALLVIRLKRLPQAQVEGVTVLRIPGWTAFTFGLLRPRIYMTEAVWQSEHREAVLSHEREHVRRRDPLRRLTAISAQRLLWFLPFFRRLADQESFEAERVCDLRACQVVGRTRYARALLAFLDMRAEASLTPNLSACFGERPGAKDAALLERVRSLHAADKDATPLWFWPAFLGLYLLLLVLV